MAGLGWNASLDRLPTKNNLATRGVHFSDADLRCVGCNQTNESIAHLFFECNVFLEVWRKCLSWLGVEPALYADCKTNFKQFMALSTGKSDMKSNWQVIWFAGIWSIWLNRNELIFNNKRASVENMFEQVQL